MTKWAKRAGVEWAINEAIIPPAITELEKMPIEDVGHEFLKMASHKDFPFLIREIEND